MLAGWTEIVAYLFVHFWVVSVVVEFITGTDTVIIVILLKATD